MIGGQHLWALTGVPPGEGEETLRPHPSGAVRRSGCGPEALGLPVTQLLPGLAALALLPLGTFPLGQSLHLREQGLGSLLTSVGRTTH